MEEKKEIVIDEVFVKELNDKYINLSVKERLIELQSDFDMNEVMLTSSFAATSAYLLHVFSEVYPKHRVYFIDTGYHFEDTIIYKDYLTKLYDLNVEAVKAEDWKHTFTTEDQTWLKNPDYCCSINKVEPLNKIKNNYKVWVSGLMKWQSDFRSTLNVFELREDILKFYPLFDVTREEREKYISDKHLPFHPLVGKGYFSIGCKHCTVPGEGREGRWNNNPKTECGLHL